MAESGNDLIQFWRGGITRDVLTKTPADGEPLYDKQKKHLRIGDGGTPGGNALDYMSKSGEYDQLSSRRIDELFWEGDPSYLLDVEYLYYFDTRKDSDGGAWRIRCGHTSWAKEGVPTGSFVGSYSSVASAVAGGGIVDDWYYDINLLDFRRITNHGAGSEAATDIFRAGKSEFPEQFLVTISSNNSRVIIWDATLATPQMWMSFTVSGNNMLGTGTPNSCDYKDGMLAFGFATWAVQTIDFINDNGYRYSDDATITHEGYYVGNISERNDGNFFSREHIFTIVDSDIYDVCVFTLRDAPIDRQTGLPYRSIAIAAVDGLGVIKNQREHVTLSTTRHFCVDANDRGELVVVTDDDGAAARTNPRVSAYDENLENPILIANASHPGIGANGWGSIVHAVWSDDQILISADSAEPSQVNADRLIRYILNRENEAASLAAWITSEFNTGWLCGDVIGLWFCDTNDHGDLGPSTDICTNGQFGTNTDGWTALNSATLAAVSGQLEITNTAAEAGAAEYKMTGLTVGKHYYVQADYDLNTSTSITFRVYAFPNEAGGRQLSIGASSGTGTFISGFTAIREDMYLVLANDAVNGSVSKWDNVIIYDNAIANRESSLPAPLWVDSGTVNVLKTTGELASFGVGVLVNNDLEIINHTGDLFVMLLTDNNGDIYISTAGTDYIYPYDNLDTENGWGIKVNGAGGAKSMSFDKIVAGVLTGQISGAINDRWESVFGWKVLSFRKRGDHYSFEINGDVVVSGTGDAALTAGTQFCVRGVAGKYKNLQVSKTPPTDEQLKFMADELLAMVNENVLIAGNSSTPVSPVKSLPGNGALFTTSQGVSRFNGLIREGSSLEDEPELLVDGSGNWIGDFEQADGVLVSPYTAWSGVNATLSVQDKLLKVANSSGVTGHAERVFSGLVSGDFYVVHWDYHHGTASVGQVTADGATTLGFENVTAVGSGEFQFKADGSTVTIRLKNNDATNGVYGFYNNVRLRKAKAGVPLHAAGNRDIEVIAGQHAVQVQKKQRRVRPESPAIIIPKKRETFYMRDLVKNGDFTTNTDHWVAADSGVLTIDTNRLKVDNGAASYGVGYQIIPVIPGRYYDINMDITNGTHPARVRLGHSSYFGAEYADSTGITGAQNWQILAVAPNLYITLSPNSSSSGDDCLFDNVTGRQVDSAGSPYYSLPGGFRPVDILIDGNPSQDGHECTVVFDGFAYSIIPVTDFTTAMRVLAEEF